MLRFDGTVLIEDHINQRGIFSINGISASADNITIQGGPDIDITNSVEARAITISSTSTARNIIHSRSLGQQIVLNYGEDDIIIDGIHI